MLALVLATVTGAADGNRPEMRKSAGEPSGGASALSRSQDARRNSVREAWGIHQLGQFLIEVRKRKGGATVTVRNRQGDVLSRRVFSEEEFEAVGGYSGLCILEVQPMPNAFLIMKYGAYAGRALLIDQDGRMLEYPGGLYFYDFKGQRLFLQEVTDVDAVTTVLNGRLKLICASVKVEHLR